ncbi:MAG: VWA domain-containing protein [Myxococcales bacterium]|nr:VWA domain-containing protein [Myxococcales bacterium]
MSAINIIHTSRAPLAVACIFLLAACMSSHGEGDGALEPTRGDSVAKNGEADSELAGGGGSGGSGSGSGTSTTSGSFGNTSGDPGTNPATADTGAAATAPQTATNTNIAFSGAADFGYFRSLLEAGIVPTTADFDAAGFFAEHHTALPEPVCGERICLQLMLGVLGSLMNGNNCTMLQLGLNSPIAIDPQDRPPLNLAVVIDVSGSMNTDQKIDFVRDGLNLLIDGMRDSDMLTLITYSDAATVVAPLEEVSLRRAELRTIVDGLVAEGSTNLYAGLELGFKELSGSYDSGRQNRVILLSDGVATAGITGDAAILDMSYAYNSDGMGLTTIGLGTDFNAGLMRGLAEQGDGNTYFLENAGAVSEVFTEELSYFTVPVAFDLQLSLEAGTYYDFGRAVGSSLWQDTARGGTMDIPSVFLAHRESAADVTADGGRRGGGSALMIELMPNVDESDGLDLTSAQVATVDISFREPGTDAIISDQLTIDYPMAPWLTPTTGFFDSPDLAIIQKSFVMLNIYVAFEEASMLFYAGGPAEARGLLERVIAAVEDYNAEVNDIDIEYDLQMLIDMRDLMAAQGIELPGDFEVPADPWPAD